MKKEQTALKQTQTSEQTGKTKVNMKYIQYLLCVFILTDILTSCNSKTRHSSALLAYEDSVEIDSEMVLDSLYAMDVTRMSRKEKALYYVLLVRGLNLSGKLPQNDSLLAYSFSYYTKHKENKRLAQLHYLQGEIHRKNNFLMKAVESYCQANKYVKDNRLQFRLNIEMARIYRRKLMEQEGDSCLSKALSLAVNLKDSTRISEAFFDMFLSSIDRTDYTKGKDLLRKAMSILPAEKYEIMADYYKGMSRVYASTQNTDSALYYIDLAISANQESEIPFGYKLHKGDIFMAMHKLDSAEYYFAQDTNRLSLSQKVEACYKMYCLKKKQRLWADAYKCLEKHVTYRDSLKIIYREDYIERRNNMQAYKRQREKATRVEMELANNRITFYQVVVVSLLAIFSLAAISYRKERHKRKLEQQLESEQCSAMEIRVKQQETELQLLSEREEREKMEIVRLNQTVNYYKSLNAITVPVLLKNQKGTMLHLSDEEWDIVVRNTDTCFDGFTERLGRLYPQLTEEDIYFCCLMKMELSISLLAKIYHIASGSISRRKMRLKAKMGIENLTLDEFIRAF